MNDLLNPVNIGCEYCNNHPVLWIIQRIRNFSADSRFRRGVTRPFCICTVRKQSEHAAITDLGDLANVARLIKCRCLVKFEVSRAYNRSKWCFKLTPTESGMLWIVLKNDTFVDSNVMTDFEWISLKSVFRLCPYCFISLLTVQASVCSVHWNGQLV